MEDHIRFNKLNEKFERFKLRTSQEWIDIAVNFPRHFNMHSVKVCPKIIKIVSMNPYHKKKQYKKQDLIDWCYLMSKEKYKLLGAKLIQSHLSRFIKYKGPYITLDGKKVYTIPIYVGIGL
jgi:hypothetical protein